MELFIAILSLMDDTIFAVLGVPLLGELLVGYLVLSLVGLFFALKSAAGGQNRKK